MPTIRKAELRDMQAVFAMIQHYAEQRVMLPRAILDLYENVWEFTVAEENGVVHGCGALKVYSAELAELRSLCVAPGINGRGLGRTLTDQVLDEAEHLGLKTVFALTTSPGFFEKMGFREVPRERFPTKVWRDCLQCPRYYQCEEKAMMIEVDVRRAALRQPAAESLEIPASSA
ncbi:MAG: N-acetyltransferase [Acidobacteria bacterium]|nr:N-acetyltransferase [Acidobacteriota bacterium]